MLATSDQQSTSSLSAQQEYPLIVAAALTDVLHEGIRVGDDRKTVRYELYLEVTGAGGDPITRSRLFSSNRRVGVVGELQATHLLIEPAGKVRAANSIGEYSAATFDLTMPGLTWEAT
jgi:hypothetical protein